MTFNASDVNLVLRGIQQTQRYFEPMILKDPRKIELCWELYHYSKLYIKHILGKIEIKNLKTCIYMYTRGENNVEKIVNRLELIVKQLNG